LNKLLVCAAIALLAVGCSNDGDSPTDPSQVNIQFATTDLVVGTGPQAVIGNAVTVHYTGWLYNAAGTDSKGTQFDTSLDGDPPLGFTIGVPGIIAGFQQGVIGMQVGGKRRVYIPSNLGYGSSGSSNGVIPPNAALVFEISLVTLVQ